MVKAKKHEGKHEVVEYRTEEGDNYSELPIKVPVHVTIAIMLVLATLFRLLFPGDISIWIMTAAAAVASVFFFMVSTMAFQEYPKSKINIIPFFAGLMLVLILFSSKENMLCLLFSSYMVAAVLLAGKVIRLQTVIIVCLAITAVVFRIYPALPGVGSMPGHLISMDDPYFHYKYTEDLYRDGDIADTDYRMFPGDPIPISKLMPYYYNTYLSFMTGAPLHHMMILYAVLLSAFGAVMMYFLLKQLTNDWRSGAIGGFLFATLPMLLTKSAAGATEEDPMGMVMGVFSLYLLVRAMKTGGMAGIKFAVISGIAFFITSVTWQGGIQFLYAVPFAALGVYAILSILFKHDIWEYTRAGIIAGAIPLVGKMLLTGSMKPDLLMAAPFGFFMFFGVWAEVLRISLWKGKDSKLDLEKQYLMPFAIAMTLAIVIVALWLGPGNVTGLLNSTYERFAGVSVNNFLVDKTISEQGAFATGDLWTRLHRGLGSYGMGEILTILMAFVVPAFLIYYLMTRRKDQMFDLLFPYTLGLVFFMVAMTFVWVEARLGFSQSLGFILLGSMAGMLLPKNFKELGSIKILPFVIILPMLLVFTFFPIAQLEDSGIDASWDAARRGASVDPEWFIGVKWLDSHIVPSEVAGGYTPGDYVFTWWDYGHFITALSKATVITDPTQARENYIMQTARFFYNKTTEDEAIAWLMSQKWNEKDANGDYRLKYIILDFSLVGKASALAFLGTNYYQYPNGETAVNGVCSSGEICQNVENGLMAKNVDGKYTCDQGVVCPRDKMVTSIEDKKCCEESPTQCCEMSYDWKVIQEKGGSAKILRSPGTPVYGQYEISRSGYACRPEYATSLDPLVVVEDGGRKTVSSRYLYMGYSGLPYGDGGDYPAFIIFNYADGTQKLKFIDSRCETKEYGEVMGLGKDKLINIGYGIRLAEGAPAAPQVFAHVPEKWLNSMFTRLYFDDSEGLEYFKIVVDDTTKKIYPSVKIYEVTYPDQIPEIKEGAAKEGDTVEVDYTGRYENGTVFDSSEGRGPLRFKLGAGNLIKGFEEAVEGMEVNESKTVRIPPEKGYGTGNHPLANKTLYFEITLLSINKPASEVPETPEEPVNTSYVLNMTFDVYDASMIEEYDIDKYPSLVLNCQYNRFGVLSGSELNALRLIACALNGGEPIEYCQENGIYFENGSLLMPQDEQAQKVVKAVLNIPKTGKASCSTGKIKMDAFYSKSCEKCAEQKAALDQLQSELPDYVDVTYYCAGDADYCAPNSRMVLQ